jgi:hypothetical protein
LSRGLRVGPVLRKTNRPGLRKIATTLGVGVGTVHRVTRLAKLPADPLVAENCFVADFRL